MGLKIMLSKKLYCSMGYSLVEMILSVSIVGIIATTMFPFLSTTSLTFDQIETRKILITDSTIGLELVSQDLSIIHNLISANSKYIQFTTTLDTNLTIEYFLDTDGSLSRKSGFGSYQTIAENIDYNNSQFTYYDILGNAGSPVQRIRLYLLYNLNGITSPITMDIVPYTFR